MKAAAWFAGQSFTSSDRDPALTHELAYRAHLTRCTTDIVRLEQGRIRLAAHHLHAEGILRLAARVLLPALRVAKHLARASELPRCWYCDAPLAQVHLVEEEQGELPACSTCAGESDWRKRAGAR